MLNISLLSKQAAENARHVSLHNIGAGATPPNTPPVYVPTCPGCKNKDNLECIFSNAASGNMLWQPCTMPISTALPAPFVVSCDRQEAFEAADEVSFHMFASVTNSTTPCEVALYFQCVRATHTGAQAHEGYWSNEYLPPLEACGLKAACSEGAPPSYNDPNCKKLKE